MNSQIITEPTVDAKKELPVPFEWLPAPDYRPDVGAAPRPATRERHHGMSQDAWRKN